jgi:DNA polymerase III delta subunit
MIYLFIGEDEPAKSEKIHALKKQLLTPHLEQFNYEVFYAKELTPALFKEALSRLPVSSQSRLLVIKDALKLKETLQEYFLSRLESLPRDLVIILDITVIPKETSPFLNKILKTAKVERFKAVRSANAFTLARAIKMKQPEYALNILADLFTQGEKPERILGGLRYQLVQTNYSAKDRINKIKLLLETDISLKTGRLKPSLALEALVIKLCH